VAVEKLINLPKRKRTSSKNKGTSSKNQVFELEISEANLVAFYNFMGPNNYLVILDICSINERKEIRKSLIRRLEKSNLDQLQQSLILIDLEALLESTNRN
jgi:DNA-binding Lrp family transcriptional regulator